MYRPLIFYVSEKTRKFNQYFYQRNKPFPPPFMLISLSFTQTLLILALETNAMKRDRFFKSPNHSKTNPGKLKFPEKNKEQDTFDHFDIEIGTKDMSKNERMRLISEMINRETPLLEIQQKMNQKNERSKKKNIYTSEELAKNIEGNFKFKQEKRQIEDEFNVRGIRIDQISAELDDLQAEERFGR